MGIPIRIILATLMALAVPLWCCCMAAAHAAERAPELGGEHVCCSTAGATSDVPFEPQPERGCECEGHWNAAQAERPLALLPVAGDAIGMLASTVQLPLAPQSFVQPINLTAESPPADTLLSRGCLLRE